MGRRDMIAADLSRNTESLTCLISPSRWASFRASLGFAASGAREHGLAKGRHLHVQKDAVQAAPQERRPLPGGGAYPLTLDVTAASASALSPGRDSVTHRLLVILLYMLTTCFS